jgi:hypothetical protein
MQRNPPAAENLHTQSTILSRENLCISNRSGWSQAADLPAGIDLTEDRRAVEVLRRMSNGFEGKLASMPFIRSGNGVGRDSKLLKGHQGEPPIGCRAGN